MTLPQSCVPLGMVGAISLVLGLMGCYSTNAQETVSVAEITPQVLVFATTAGNVVASVGPDGALLVGTLPAASTPYISGVLTSRTKSAVRYVVVGPQDSAHSEGDAGWGRLGAFVAMHENALRRLGGNAMGAPSAMSQRFTELGVDRPRVAFSEVLALDINGDSIHIVHQKPGYSDADAIVHFHVAKLIYLGEVFAGDGYPAIDPAQGGTLAGLLSTLDAWAGTTFRFVPARGEVTNGASVKAFRDMIVAVRDRVKHRMDEGRTEAQIVAEHPTADFDARWGKGRLQPDQFVHAVYAALKNGNQK